MGRWLENLIFKKTPSPPWTSLVRKFHENPRGGIFQKQKSVSGNICHRIIWLLYSNYYYFAILIALLKLLLCLFDINSLIRKFHETSYKEDISLGNLIQQAEGELSLSWGEGLWDTDLSLTG